MGRAITANYGGTSYPPILVYFDWFRLHLAIAFSPQVAVVIGLTVVFLPLALRQGTRTLFSSQGTEKSIPPSWLDAKYVV